jgi:hypothetical protein
MQEHLKFQASLTPGSKNLSQKQNKSIKTSRHWWLRTVILATQEAEIRKIMV